MESKKWERKMIPNFFWISIFVLLFLSLSEGEITRSPRFTTQRNFSPSSSHSSYRPSSSSSSSSSSFSSSRPLPSRPSRFASRSTTSSSSSSSSSSSLTSSDSLSDGPKRRNFSSQPNSGRRLRSYSEYWRQVSFWQFSQFANSSSLTSSSFQSIFNYSSSAQTIANYFSSFFTSPPEWKIDPSLFDGIRVSEAVTCPSVYVYPLPEFFIGPFFSNLYYNDSTTTTTTTTSSSRSTTLPSTSLSSSSSSSSSSSNSLGFPPPEKSIELKTNTASLPSHKRYTPLSSNLYSHTEYTLAEILTERLLTSSHCRTNDPNKADLFFVPVTPGGGDQLVRENECNRLSRRSLLPHLTYLTQDTAHRHFFAVGKRHYGMKECFGWWVNPTGLLEETVRVSYSEIAPEVLRDDFYGPGEVLLFEKEGLDFPNLVSTPYPATFRSPGGERGGEEQPWEVRERDIFALFLVRSNIPRDQAFVSSVTRMCRENNQRCRIEEFSKDTIPLKKRSLFCIQSFSHSLYRKDLYDSLVYGCIPVSFSKFTQYIARPFFGHNASSMIIQVPMEPFLQQNLNLIELLSSIPTDVLRHMRQTITENARKFQFSIQDDPGDALYVVLNAVQRLSQQIEKEKEKREILKEKELNDLLN